jgi:hypothetical protein
VESDSTRGLFVPLPRQFGASRKEKREEEKQTTTTTTIEEEERVTQ